MSSVKGRLLSMVVFSQRSSPVKGRLLSNVVFRQRSSSAKGRLPSKVSFIRGRHQSKVVFHQSSSSIEGRLPLLGHFHFWVLVLSVALLNSAFCYLCHYFSLRAGTLQWSLMWWISRRYCQRGRCQRGPKILNICRTESYFTKNWGRISPEIYRCHQK